MTELRQRLAREFNVMVLLTRPYISEKVESDYFKSMNVSNLDDMRGRDLSRLEATRMPGKKKRTNGSKYAVRRRANVGNLLHEHNTVEDSLAHLMNRNRWD